MTNTISEMGSVVKSQKRNIDLIVVHCSATQADPKIDRKAIDLMHRQRGFKCIGYHYVITTDGAVQLGRNIDEPGAHVENHNKNSIGICMIGGVDSTGKPCNNFTKQQFQTLDLLLDLLLSYYSARVCGHRDLSPDLNNDGKISIYEHIKACPCFDVEVWLNSGGKEFGSVV